MQGHMQTAHINITTPPSAATSRSIARLEDLVRRVQAHEFSSQNAIAEAYKIDHGTASRWKDRAILRGLIGFREWEHALLKGKLRESEK